MPTKIEKDIVTGQDTTGHEWDGLKELNTPLPKWWLYVLYATIAWAAVWCVLYPSVPGITGYFHGVLGYSQRTAVDNEVRAVAELRAGAMDKIRSLSFADIRKDPQLMAAADTAGRISLRQQLSALPRRWRRRSAGVSGARCRRLDLGRFARCDPADHHLRYPQRRRQGTRLADAALWCRWHSEAR